MTFVAAAPVPPEAPLPHHPFWPGVCPGTFRDSMSIDGNVSAPRLLLALTEAVVFVNAELKKWRISQEQAGHIELAAVPDDDGEPHWRIHRYLRAVYETAAADIMERYRQFDATGDAQSRAEQQQPAIDDHRRNAFWAIRDILGQTRTTVELL
ncbi:MAG: head completion/stabilization protein [Azoarcus sp.]|jgi:hypothetical protein|nr:head completion/stabilization protein [Azoarcus sp.]